jgi:hypothetical protein
MTNISSAMGAQFAELVTAMVDRLRELGPSPLKDSKIAAMQQTGGNDDRR